MPPDISRNTHRRPCVAADGGAIRAGQRRAARSAGAGAGDPRSQGGGSATARISAAWSTFWSARKAQPQAAVIDFGGFMGVGSRKIAVEWSALHFAPGDAKHPITLDLTQDQIKAAPEYKDVAKPAPVVVARPRKRPPSPR